MKKKLIIFLLIILLIIAVIFIIEKINDSKINYEISKVNIYNFFEYYEDKKYGVIDKDGNIIIPANYNKIIIPNPERDVFICYNSDGNIQVFNSNKQEIFTEFNKVEPIKLKNVASILCYEKSVLKYEKDGLYGLIDFNGKTITKNIYNSIENLQSTEGKFLVSKNSKYGVINIKGKTLVKTDYDSIKTDEYFDIENEKNVKSGFIVSITTDDGYKYGYIDYKGKEILEVKFSDIVRIRELRDIYLIVSENGKYGAYKKDKNFIPHEYQSIIYDLSGGFIIQKNKNYGMANLKGVVKIPVNYTNIETKGIYIYAHNQRENIVYDYQGNKIDISFNKSIYETENSQYRVSIILNNDIMYYGIENKDGATLVKEGYSYIEYVFGDYFIAKDEKSNMGLINANGKTIIDFKYDSIQKIKGKNLIQISNKNKTYIYSSNLEVICEMKGAIIDNRKEFIKIYNDKKEKYFNNEGKEIFPEDEIIKKSKLNDLPEKIGEYVKTQYSLDNAFYVKK